MAERYVWIVETSDGYESDPQTRCICESEAVAESVADKVRRAGDANIKEVTITPLVVISSPSDVTYQEYFEAQIDLFDAAENPPADVTKRCHWEFAQRTLPITNWPRYVFGRSTESAAEAERLARAEFQRRRNDPADSSKRR